MADINDARNIEGHYQNQLEKLDKAFEDGDIAESDYNAIKDYHTYKKRRVSIGTMTTYLSKLRVSATRSDKPLIDFTSTTDVEDLLDAHESEGCRSAKGLNNHLSAIRGLFEWLDATPEFGHENYRFRHFIENVKPSDRNPGTEPVDPDFVLSESELAQIRKAAKYPVIGALAEFMGDVGARVTLACQVKRGGLELPDRGTGGTFRPNPEGLSHKSVPDEGFRLHDCTGHLRRYLANDHPDDHPDAPLFPKLDYKPSERSDGAFNSKTAGYHLKKAAERAGIEPERAHPHNFRKLAISRMRVKHGMSWEAIQLRTGISDNSLDDIKEAYRRLNEEEKHKIVDRELGIDIDDSEPAAEDVSVECPGCTREYTPDGPDAQICPYCGANRNASADTKYLTEERAMELIGAALQIDRTGEPADDPDEIRQAVDDVKMAVTEGGFDSTPISEELLDQ